MPAFADGRLKENLDNLANLVFAHQVSAQTEHIAMVVLAASPGGDLLVNQRRPDAMNFVGHHRHADAAAVHEDADVALAIAPRRGAAGAAKSG